MQLIVRAVVVGALLLLLVPAATASARTFSGSISVVNVSTPVAPYGSVTVTAQLTIHQTCDPVIGSPTYEYCGYFPFVTTVPGGQVCSPTISGSSWVGSVYEHDTAPGTKAATATWSDWPSIFSGLKRACLYVTGGDMVDTLVAENVYTVPPEPPAPPPPPAVPTVDYDCEDFAYQQDAQSHLLPDDPYRLDADNDGIACDELPSRPTPVSLTPVTPSLRLSEARSAARKHLRKRYSSYRRGGGRWVSCVKTSRLRARCSVGWRFHGRRYRGTVRVRALDVDTLSLRSSVRRTAGGRIATASSEGLTLAPRRVVH